MLITWPNLMNGPQTFQGHPNALRPRQYRHGLGGPSQHDPLAPLQILAQVDPLHQVTEAVIQQHGDNLPGPAEMAEEPEGMRFQMVFGMAHNCPRPPRAPDRLRRSGQKMPALSVLLRAVVE
ncbi:MAG TPA: hypothetical protein EYP14_06580 [Planctomycetaceae bacterium]|nr:hypothetical protein [Planctomycetaceae bacterium]